ncbi:MAG TPA: alpha-amylase family glycosyl hydrolase [Ginsengibacter sp.]
MKKNTTIALLSFYFTVFFISCIPNITPAQTKSNVAGSSVHPSWSEQSNIYEVNLRQYTASSSIKDFEKSLPRLKKMGVEILWFMPITPIGIEGRKMTSNDLGSYYAVRDYKAVNPEFGTMADWKNLVKHAHGLGFKVITDWVPNHTSPDNPWVTNHPDFYKRDSSGNTVYDADYYDTRNLNYANMELRDSMIEVMKFWVKETGIDGFRCDHVDPIPVDFWKRCIDSLKKLKNVFMLAESQNSQFHLAGFDATYGWAVMEGWIHFYAGKLSLGQEDSIINDNIQKFPKSAYRVFFTTNHDWNTWEGTEFERYGDSYKAMAVFSQTMYQSLPLIYNGQEIPNKRRLKFFIKDPIVWNQYKMAPFYSTLLHLRKSNPALAADASYKKLITANDMAIFAYTRMKGAHKIAVILNLSNQPQRFTIDDKSIFGNPLNVFLGVKEKVNTTHVFSIEPWGFIVYEYK